MENWIKVGKKMDLISHMERGEDFYVWSGHWSVKSVWWVISEIEVIGRGVGGGGTGPLVSMHRLYQLFDRCEIPRINQ